MKGFFFTIAVAVGAAVSAQTKTIEVINPSAIERQDELVVLKRAWIKRKLPALKEGQYLLITDKKTPQLVQFDDLDGDGNWDEAVLLLNLAPRQKKVLSIAASDRPAAIKAAVRAYVRQKHRLPDNNFGNNVMADTMPYNNVPTDFSKQQLPPYLTEGPAWENDKVGFRKYFDIRNANDIWGKRVPQMVLDEVGTHPGNSYHNLSDWGMDILKVGKSLGAGALALRTKVKGNDSLFRFGRNVQQTVYRQLSSGPLRAVFEIQYKNWNYLPDATPINVTEQISIWGGQYFFENKVTFSNLPANASLVTGTIDFYSKQDYRINRSGIAGLYTYDQQSENKDQLGLGILTAASNVKTWGHITTANTDVTNVFTLDMKISAGRPVVYRYYVGWELTDKAFATQQGFEKMMRREAEKFTKPLVVR
ncbi:DUF4861 domain-containing protein [Niabella sp. CC-SYL272]|uniref:DUF4861 domain-containing protein n=1 Tax=Niabella agricola TaxID=2891571 RepID=UPI001F187E25|nr:DUF4861 domain-containing protein [Niabella agricola]MCF3109957.1 DUF4861 domain-containing protein [Niabella agricola]